MGGNSNFDAHFDVISTVKCIQMFELTKPSAWRNQNFPFKELGKNEGSILLDYSRYDAASSGSNDLDNFQVTEPVGAKFNTRACRQLNWCSYS
jgi:hypothetical protein